MKTINYFIYGTLILMCFTGINLVNAQTFKHPGIFLTQTDLSKIRSNVTVGKEPWKSAWDAIHYNDAGIDYTLRLGTATTVTDAYAIQNDGHAAWALAIKWVASGDKVYADKAISIVDAWVNQVSSMQTDGLRTGLGSAQMANAAEILAWSFEGSSGWSVASINKAKAWFKSVPYTRCNTAYSANWGTSAMAGCMAMSIFCDDKAMFDNSVTIYKDGFSPLSKGCCGVTQYIDATGENAESGRDQGHSQGGIGHLMEVAMMAWNQGVNLVTYNDNYGVRDYGVKGENRLFIGLEYTAKYNLGNAVSYHPFYEFCNNVVIYPNGISEKGRGNFSPIWEMAVCLFRKIGFTPTYCQQVIAKNSYQPEKTNSDHTGLGTLLYSADVAKTSKTK